MTTTRNPAGTAGRKAIRYWRWQDAGGLVAPGAALALWVAVWAAVAGPLAPGPTQGAERQDGVAARAEERAPCPLPPDALASVAHPADLLRCR